MHRRDQTRSLTSPRRRLDRPRQSLDDSTDSIESLLCRAGTAYPSLGLSAESIHFKIEASKAELENSIPNMCLAGATFREKNDDDGRNFCSHWRPIRGRIRTKNTTINQINVFMHILGALLCDSGSIGLLWLSWCRFSSAALFRGLEHRLIVLHYIFSYRYRPMKLKLSHE